MLSSQAEHNISYVYSVINQFKLFLEITLKTIKKDEKLEFEDNSFDILICNVVLEHFSSEKILINNVKEMSRISKNLFSKKRKKQTLI